MKLDAGSDDKLTSIQAATNGATLCTKLSLCMLAMHVWLLTILTLKLNMNSVYTK